MLQNEKTSIHTEEGRFAILELPCNRNYKREEKRRGEGRKGEERRGERRGCKEKVKENGDMIRDEG